MVHVSNSDSQGSQFNKAYTSVPHINLGSLNGCPVARNSKGANRTRVFRQFIAPFINALLGETGSKAKHHQWQKASTSSSRSHETAKKTNAPAVNALIGSPRTPRSIVEKQKNWSPSKVFENKSLYNLMKQYCCSNKMLAPEPFYFMEKANIALKIPDTDVEQFKEAFKEICDNCFKEGSENTLNISGGDRKTFIELFNKEPFDVKEAKSQLKTYFENAGVGFQTWQGMVMQFKEHIDNS